ncbi:MAG: AraC family transcriptional regulator [Roseiflexaceae bacterium]
MDVLSDVFDVLRLRSSSLFRATLHAPWAVTMPGQPDVAPCYIVSSGSCVVEVVGNPTPLHLRQHDLVLLPHGNTHILRAEQGGTPVTLADLRAAADRPGAARELSYGGEGPATVLIVGAFQLERRLANLLFPDAGAVVYVRAGEANPGEWLDMLSALICGEALAGQPGGNLAVSRLMDLLFLQLVRGHIAADPEPGQNGSFLRALADPQLLKALELIHQHPEHAWTVAELAARVNMSRTAFATRFARIAGVPPLMYVRQWRMLLASAQLRRGDGTLDEIAERAGYDSGPAFAKAFKRETGLTPGAYRRKAARGMGLGAGG